MINYKIICDFEIQTLLQILRMWYFLCYTFLNWFRNCCHIPFILFNLKLVFFQLILTCQFDYLTIYFSTNFHLLFSYQKTSISQVIWYANWNSWKIIWTKIDMNQNGILNWYQARWLGLGTEHCKLVQYIYHDYDIFQCKFVNYIREQVNTGNAS